MQGVARHGRNAILPAHTPGTTAAGHPHCTARTGYDRHHQRYLPKMYRCFGRYLGVPKPLLLYVGVQSRFGDKPLQLLILIVQQYSSSTTTAAVQQQQYCNENEIVSPQNGHIVKQCCMYVLAAAI